MRLLKKLKSFYFKETKQNNTNTEYPSTYTSKFHTM
ncbi:hypothetical protein KVMX100_220059 [Klebsiella variicola]|nr:hypothetical protein KVMX100_220059 [Klebsiella variicola]